MISIELDDSALAKQIRLLENADGIIGVEFKDAGFKTVNYLAKDLQGGISSVSGNLKRSITAEVKTFSGGIEMGSQIVSRAQHGGYEYGVRLDKDGSMRWRSGKFKSYRTFGWFTKVLERIAPKAARKFYQAALDRAVKKLVV